MSFMVAAFIVGLFQKRPDVIVATSPQLFAALGAWMLAAVRRRPFIFELRDLWPASIVAVGALQDIRIVFWLEKLELFLYRQATSVVSVTSAFKADLTERGISEGKIAVVINGVDLDRYAPRPRDQDLALEYELHQKFVVGYIGTHGMAHALHRVLEAAELLRDWEDIVFLFVGGGATRAELLVQTTRMGLKNVRLIPRQPKELMPRVWSVCDVALIHLKNDSLFKAVLPSKIFEAMAMGLPILLVLPDGEAAAMIRETGAGIIVPPGKPELLATAVTELYNQPRRLDALRHASSEAAPNFSRKRQAEKMLAVFQAALEGKGDSVGLQNSCLSDS